MTAGFQPWPKQKKICLTSRNTIDGAKYKDIVSLRFCLHFSFYDGKKMSRFRFLELWPEPIEAGWKQPNLSVVGVSALVERVV